LEFWQVYPKRVEKIGAYQCWKARLKEGVKAADMITAAKHYGQKVESEGTPPTFMKKPETFLGPRRPYEDFVGGNGSAPVTIVHTWEDDLHFDKHNHYPEWENGVCRLCAEKKGAVV
jgi:hypothetical protein